VFGKDVESMTQIRVSAERVLAAPADIVYHCIADYVRHHNPSGFLPPAFSEFAVEQGGVGAGTAIRFTVAAGGQRQQHRAVVSEPQPGQVLVESEQQNALTTTFVVQPHGQHARVRFETAYSKSGIQGWIEGLVAPRLLRSLYADELAQLERHAQEHGPLAECAGD
jgi:hypothetical protein